MSGVSFVFAPVASHQLIWLCTLSLCCCLHRGKCLMCNGGTLQASDSEGGSSGTVSYRDFGTVCHVQNHESGGIDRFSGFPSFPATGKLETKLRLVFQAPWKTRIGPGN